MSAPDGTIGALNVGSQISYLLLGILVSQGYNYYVNYPGDPKWVRWFVGIVIAMEIAHGVTVGAADYVISVTNYGKPETISGKTPFMLDLWILFSGFLGPMVQAFFARRIFVISGSWYIPLLCWALSFVRLIGSMALFYGTLVMKTLEQYDAQWRWCLIAVLVIGAVTDTIIAITLCISFHNQRQTALPRTARLLTKLTGWTIQTGLITSISGILMLILFLASPHTFVWLGIYEVLPRMFSNSLLASLNARSNFRNTAALGLTMQSTVTANKGTSEASQTSNIKFTPIAIEMTRVTASDGTKQGDIESNSILEPSKVDHEEHTM